MEILSAYQFEFECRKSSGSTKTGSVSGLPVNAIQSAQIATVGRHTPMTSMCILSELENPIFGCQCIYTWSPVCVPPIPLEGDDPKDLRFVCDNSCDKWPSPLPFHIGLTKYGRFACLNSTRKNDHSADTIEDSSITKKQSFIAINTIETVFMIRGRELDARQDSSSANTLSPNSPNNSGPEATTGIQMPTPSQVRRLLKAPGDTRGRRSSSVTSLQVLSGSLTVTRSDLNLLRSDLPRNAILRDTMRHPPVKRPDPNQPRGHECSEHPDPLRSTGFAFLRYRCIPDARVYNSAPAPSDPVPTANSLPKK